MIDPRKLLPDTVPVVINNFNRLDSLRIQIDWLCGLDEPVSIIILDNASTYPPLRRYYRTLRGRPNIQVVFLGYNSGLEGISDVADELRDCPCYVVTDPDLVPYASTPSDILARMRAVLQNHEALNHVGASMEIDDIPDVYPMKAEVVEWESRYWPPQARAVDDVGYAAWVDTTFGMYRGTSDVTRIEPALRLARPYTLRHVDWYADPTRLSDEQRYYQKTCRDIGSWTTRLRARRPGG